MFSIMTTDPSTIRPKSIAPRLMRFPERPMQFLLQDPNIRFRVGDKLYKGRATVVEDPELINDLFETLAQKYRGGVDRTPEQRARYRFIRIDSR